MNDEKQVPVLIDPPKNIESQIPELGKSELGTKIVSIDLKKYDILQPQEHQFINTVLQLSNQILGLKRQYQQQKAAIDDITQTIKDLKARKYRHIYIMKGGMFMVEAPITKDYIHNLQKRRDEIINANNITVGQIQKNFEVYTEYRRKVAGKMAKYLDDETESQKIIKMEDEIDKEAKDILTDKDL